MSGTYARVRKRTPWAGVRWSVRTDRFRTYQNPNRLGSGSVGVGSEVTETVTSGGVGSVATCCGAYAYSIGPDDLDPPLINLGGRVTVQLNTHRLDEISRIRKFSTSLTRGHHWTQQN